jgi:nicotinamidase-related amidase
MNPLRPGGPHRHAVNGDRERETENDVAAGRRLALEALSIDRSRSVVLAMDYQSGIVTGYATDQEALLQRAAGVLARARQAGFDVIYVTVRFRPGYPEVSPRDARFSAIKESGRFLAGTDADVHPAVAPHPGDIMVVKHRVSAFAGTDLDMILRAKGTETLILFGIATSGVVLSTVRHAADADYRLVVLKDCCADRDPDVHQCLMDKVFPGQATVITAAECLAAL